MNPMLNIAVRAARRAGEVIVRSMNDLDKLVIENKAPNDFVSEVDRHAEAVILEVIHKAYPDHGILAEESGSQEGNEFQWVIDPLDGTTNYLHGFPQFSVSIAVRQNNKLMHGVIYDPLREEMFTASRGAGAQLNNRRIRVTGRHSLDGALLGTGFPFKELKHLDAYLLTFAEFVKTTAGVRRAGSAALDLAYVAAGRMDGFWEIGLKPWDMAAGVLIIQEAGGLVSDFAGNAGYFNSGNLVTANPKLFKLMLQRLRPLLPEALLR